MKKRITAFVAVIIIMCSIMAGGCGRQDKIEFWQTGFPYSEQKAGDGMIVSIGSLTLTIPLGWQMEIRQEDGVTQYVLADVHTQCENEDIESHQEGYEHEIIITPYKITQMPEKTLQLAAAMKEYFPVPILYGLKGTGKTEEIAGCWMYGEYRDTEEKEYFLFSRKDSLQDDHSEERELFHVRESIIYDYKNDVENFKDFLYEGMAEVNGEGLAEENRPYGYRIEYYYWFNLQGESPLFTVMQGSFKENDGTITVYQKGNYETEIASLQMEELNPDWIEIMDIDQDGDEDFVCRYFLVDSFNSLLFTEEEDFDGYLWDEEQKTFLYTAGDVMLEEYGYIWEEGRNVIDYEQGAERIPEELIAYLMEHLLKSREELQNAMLSLVSDRELTLEEVQELAGDNKDIKNEILSIASAYGGYGIWLQVDADNDGIEDIYLSEFLGGSLGSVYCYLFAGREDGNYELTEVMEGIREEFAFIKWEGRNYLAKTTYDFGKKIYNGISLESFEDGIFQGGICLTITPKEGSDFRKIKTSYVKEEKYISLEAELRKFSEEYQTGEKVKPGTAEEEDEEADYCRKCDIDNDGEVEEYNVSRWLTTNYYTVDCMKFCAGDEELYARVYRAIDEEEIRGIPMNMWVDKTEYGNMIFILYEDNLYDFHICGWLLSEGTEEKVIQIECQVQTEVTKKILKEKPGRIIH